MYLVTFEVIKSCLHWFVGKYLSNLWWQKEEFEDTKSESVYRRRTENTMVKRKNTKGQTTINKTYK
jgi:hypothetical protein